MGAGAGAFAMRMARVAIPVLRKYILPAAKHHGKNLLEPAIPEIGQGLAGKRPNIKMMTHFGETAAEKSLRKSPSMLSGGVPRRAVGRREGPQLSPNRGRTAQAEGDATLFVHHHPRQSSPTIISKRKPAKRSRSDILSEIQFV